MILIRYFGGKSKLAKPISDYINNLLKNKQYSYYVEPFCGACNVASKINFEKKILNDKNQYLIEMFNAVQKGWIPPIEVSEQEYINIKEDMNKIPHLAGFVGFACSFAGKFWGGYARDGVGRRQVNYAKRGSNSIVNLVKILEDSNFICDDFLNLDYNNCMIYCDPPYKNTTPYYKKILGEFPYDDFIEWAKIQSKKNTLIISEYKHNVPSDAKILLEIPSSTSIRDKNNNVIKTIEVLYMF